MKKTEFNIPKMDCSSEEQMIRMKLEGVAGIQSLLFDIPNRKLTIFHLGEIVEASLALKELDLGAELFSSSDVDDEQSRPVEDSQRTALRIVLAINIAFFLIEIVAGLIAKSMGLLGDSLDMLADSIVYALSLMAVGRALSYKKLIAKMSGWLQLTLAALGFAEVLRRFLGYSDIPIFEVMIFVSIFALIGNAISLIVINRTKSDEVHMKASAIFTSNDIIVNLGVIIAGILVKLTSTAYPDLIIGAVLFWVVARGAFRIMKLAK
ncbi:MAG: cation transporter [Candidatus Marinimicrobia bacterium]|nr:cation transporter [Candidatus Neomarinimicrobiota bacterium]